MQSYFGIQSNRFIRNNNYKIPFEQRLSELSNPLVVKRILRRHIYEKLNMVTKIIQ